MRSDLLVRVTADPIGAGEAVEFVSDPAAGGTCVFLGTVRDHSDAGAVTGLTYEAWDEQAERRLEELAEEMFARWPLRRVAFLHRFGELAPGERYDVPPTAVAPKERTDVSINKGVVSAKLKPLSWNVIVTMPA